MKPKKPEQKKPSDLRKRAEEKLKSQITPPAVMSDKETQQLIHELQVHQIELEMQNDELRKAQAELEESRTKYSDLYDFAPVGYFTFDKNGLILEANLTAAKGLLVERGFLINKPFRTHIVAEDRKIYDQHLQKVLNSEERQTCEIRLKKKDGSEIYAKLESIAVNDFKGNSLCRTSVSDITESKKAEEALQKSEEKYHTVADFTYDWEDWLDPSGKYIYVSPSCEWITGYHRDELLDIDMVLKMTHPDDRETVIKHFHEVLSDSIEIHHMDFRIITRSGDERWLDHYSQPVYSNNGTFLGRRGSSRDITKRKEAEEKLKQLTDELKRYNVELQSANDRLKAEIEVRERMQNALELSEERYKKMVDAVTSYTYSVQVREGNIIYAEHSIGCLPITGYSPDEFKSNPNLWYSMIFQDDMIMVENTIKEILAGHKAPAIEHRIIRRDRAVIWVRNTMAPYYNNDGALIRCDGLIEDISERKQAEEKLKQLSDELKRSNEDLQRFATAASHDLQEPLRGIEGFIKLLEKRYKGKLDEKADEFIDYIVDDVKRMRMLIKDLLEYSRVSIRGVVFSPANCSVVLEHALSNIREAMDESGAEITYDLLPTVMGDDAQLSRLFQNLIVNAIKFRSKEPIKIQISAHREGDEWIFSFRDNGIGIDPKQAERIFIIFQRLHTKREYPGTGIGLAICKRIVDRHDGRIWVESEPGKGATFYFTIPEKQGNLLNMYGEESSDKSSDS